MFHAIVHFSKNDDSIGIGAIFSPPAVMISSFIHPVISKNPSTYFPKSPE